jgi:antitoxin component HigA of HigAB toxin-antitoxin module
MKPTPLPPIQSDEEYSKLLAECEPLVGLDPEPHTPEGARLLELATAIEAWEKPRYSFAAVTAPELLHDHD